MYISSVIYSPDAAHLAAGLSTGEVEVFEMSSSSSIFTLSKPEVGTNQASLLSTIISVSQNGLPSCSLDSFPSYLSGVYGGWEALCCRTPERSAPTLGRKTKLCLHPIAPNPSPSFHISIHNFNRMSLDYLLLISTHFLHIFLTRIVAM